VIGEAVSKYLEFLTYLLSFGPKLPAVVESLQAIMAELQKIADLFGGGLGVAPPDSTPEEQAAEEQLAAVAGRSGPLQNILAFIKANPELLALLLSLIKK
jgi:hypothetical protein